MSELLENTLIDINTKLGVISDKVIEMEAYQKNHWETLQKHEKKIEEAASEEDYKDLEVRVRANERGMIRANTLYAIGMAALTAWAADIASIFSKGGN